MPGIYYGYRKKHEMTDIKTLVRKLLAGKLPQKEMPELWQRHDVTQYMQREWDRCAKPAEDDLLRESRIWERIVARTIPHEKRDILPKNIGIDVELFEKIVLSLQTFPPDFKRRCL